MVIKLKIKIVLNYTIITCTKTVEEKEEYYFKL